MATQAVAQGGPTSTTGVKKDTVPTKAWKTPARVNRLGTETAYTVALEAAAAKERGITVYPFHIGDLNFRSPPFVVDACKKAIDEGKTGYCAAAGINPLREELAKRIGGDRNVHYTAANVSVQTGGKPVIMKFLLSVMEEGDECLYPSPGYPIYESGINYLGGVSKAYGYKNTGKSFVIDIEGLKKQITPKTKVLIVNTPSNPMGAVSSDEELTALAKIAIDHDMWVLSDEPYFDLDYNKTNKIPSLVTIPGMQERTVLLYTYSKNYAMTGWRLGCACGPVDIMTHFNKLNTNFEGCTPHFLQWAAYECLKNREESDKFLDDLMAQLRQRRDRLVRRVAEIPGFECFPPEGTFYLYVEVTKAVEALGCANVEVFRKKLLEETGVSVCTREHFGARTPTEEGHYVRFAFSSADDATIDKACDVLRHYMTTHMHSGPN